MGQLEVIKKTPTSQLTQNFLSKKQVPFAIILFISQLLCFLKGTHF